MHQTRRLEFVFVAAGDDDVVDLEEELYVLVDKYRGGRGGNDEKWERGNRPSRPSDTTASPVVTAVFFRSRGR